MAIAGFLGIILARKGSAVWSISPDATVFEAIQLMADKNVGALPVVDNSRLIGIRGFLHIPAKRFNPGFRVDSKMTLYQF